MYYRSQIKYLKIYYNFQHLSSKKLHSQPSCRSRYRYLYGKEYRSGSMLLPDRMFNHWWSLDYCCHWYWIASHSFRVMGVKIGQAFWPWHAHLCVCTSRHTCIHVPHLSYWWVKGKRFVERVKTWTQTLILKDSSISTQ